MDFLPMHSIRRNIRVKKENSAFVYFILESYEGVTSYSTINYQATHAYRDLELRIPPDFLREVQEILESLGDKIYEIKSA